MHASPPKGCLAWSGSISRCPNTNPTASSNPRRIAADRRASWFRSLAAALVSLLPSLAWAATPAPAMLWQIPSEGPQGQAIPTALSAAADDTAYVGGVFTGTVDFGGRSLTTTSATNWECFVGRWDADGSPHWVQPIRNAAQRLGCALVERRDGGALVLGPFGEQVDFGTTNLVGPSNTAEKALFLAHYAPEGQLVSATTLATGGLLAGVPFLSAAVRLIEPTDDQRVIAGWFEGDLLVGGETLTNPTTAMFLAGFDTNGTAQWTRVLSGVDWSGYRAPLLVAHPTGDFVLAGGFENGIDLGATNFPGEGGFVARYNVQGHLVWARPLRTTALATDPTGAIYISDRLASATTEVGGWPLPDPFNATSGSYLAKLDPEGNVVWVQVFAGSWPNAAGLDLACDSTGNVHWLAQYGPGASEFFGGARFYSDTISRIMARFSPDGVLTWALDDPYRPSGASPHLALAPSGAVWIAGQVRVLGRLAASDATSPLTLLRQPPLRQFVHTGDDVQLDVEVSGAHPRTFQWLFSTLEAWSFHELPGATNAILSLTNIQDAASGLYQVVARNSFGAVTSRVAQLNLAPPSTLPGVQWARLGGGYGGRVGEEGGRSVAVDASGAIYLLADYALWSSFEDHALAARGRANFALARYESDGTLAWIQHSPGSGTDQGSGVACDPVGNVLVTGGWVHTDRDFFGTATDREPRQFLAKYNAAGNLLWAQPTGGEAVAVDANGAALVLGMARPPTDLGHTNLTEYGGFAAKYDSGGACQWLQFLPGVDWTVTRPTTDAAGGFVLGGTFASDTIIDGHTLTNLGPAGGAFFARFDATGHLDWLQPASLDRSTARLHVAADTGTAVYASADWRETFRMSDHLLSSSNTVDGVLLRLDAGNLDWILPLIAKAPPGGGRCWAQITAIAVDPLGHLFAVGRLQGRLVLPTTTAENLTLDSSTAYGDAFIVRFDRQGACLGARLLSGEAAVSPWSIALDPRGHAVITGDLGTEFDAPGLMTAFGPSVLVGRGFTDAFVARFDTSMPLLDLRPLGGSLILSWSVYDVEFLLERAPRLSPQSWITRSEPVTQAGRHREVLVPQEGAAAFYRLRR